MFAGEETEEQFIEVETLLTLQKVRYPKLIKLSSPRPDKPPAPESPKVFEIKGDIIRSGREQHHKDKGIWALWAFS